jgi:hypothetical protein
VLEGLLGSDGDTVEENELKLEGSPLEDGVCVDETVELSKGTIW